MDTANVPTVGLIQRLVVMEKPVTQIANNYITRHNTRRSQSKGRWVWIGSVLAVIGLLSFCGATKAEASSEWTPQAKAEFARQMQLLGEEAKNQHQLCGWLKYRAWESVEYAKGEDDKSKWADAMRGLEEAATYSTIITALCTSE